MKSFYEKADEVRAAAITDAFIKVVNDDHDDVIQIPRSAACLMRDEIMRLRKKAKESA